jgi:hypothetical protein
MTHVSQMCPNMLNDIILRLHVIGKSTDLSLFRLLLITLIVMFYLSDVATEHMA